MKDMQAMRDITKWVKAKKKETEKEIKEMNEKRYKHWDKLGYRLLLDQWVNVKEGLAKKLENVGSMRKLVASIRKRAASMRRLRRRSAK